jgi:hypothetical protein
LPASADGPAVEILRTAETLRIPWKRVLLEEIEAEQKLRRYLADFEHDYPFLSVLKVLSFSVLQSWRVRDKIQTLVCEARGASVPEAVRQLQALFLVLTRTGERDTVAFAEHLWFAYQRVLLLQRVRRIAARSRGTLPERLAFTCSRARCCYEDATWAVLQEDSPRPGYRLEAAVQKVREEGFLIPREDTEARSLAALRRIIRSSPRLNRRRLPRGRPLRLTSSRDRVPLSANAI